jgi:hypothetical protein
MNRCRRLFSAAAIGAWLLALALSAHAGDQNFEGRIKNVRGNDIVVATIVDSITFQVGQATSITINGRPAQIAHLKRGDNVKVSAQQSDRGLLAMQIAASRPI